MKPSSMKICGNACNSSSRRRPRPAGGSQQTLLGGLLVDRNERQIVPTYSTKRTRRYAYYETRKDLARPGDPPAARFPQGALDQHIIQHLAGLLDDEHALRRLAETDSAEHLRALFSEARLLSARLKLVHEARAAIRALVALIKVQGRGMELILKPSAFRLGDQKCWAWSIPLPDRKPFREAKLRIDAEAPCNVDQQLVQLVSDALQAQELILALPALSINQIAKREGRCRKQLHKLLRVSWLSPRIVESIVAGKQPVALTRSRLIKMDLPVDWSAQEELLGVCR